METPAIPLLDLTDFKCDHLPRRLRFIKAIGEAFKSTGFVKIKGHGFSESLRNELYEQVSNFFHLPQDQKKQYFIPELAGQRGYTPFGIEKAKDSNMPDLKEFWQFGQPYPPKGTGETDYPNNPEVKELPMFTPLGLKTYTQLEQIGVDLLRAIALFLDLPEDHFDEWVKNGNTILRAIYYPPLRESDSGIRAEAHEDINLITLIMGASAEGLEVKNRNEEWIPINANEDELIVNVGDMLDRYSNGVLKSTTHRVVNPKNNKEARYSIPLFLHPKFEMPLNPIKQCISDENPKKYEDITAGEFLQERLSEIGLK